MVISKRMPIRLNSWQIMVKTNPTIIKIFSIRKSVRKLKSKILRSVKKSELMLMSLIRKLLNQSINCPNSNSKCRNRWVLHNHMVTRCSTHLLMLLLLNQKMTRSRIICSKTWVRVVNFAIKIKLNFQTYLLHYS